MHHISLVYFAWQSAHASRWSGHVCNTKCAFKTPGPCYGPVMGHSAVVHSSVSINQSLTFVVYEHIIHDEYCYTLECCLLLKDKDMEKMKPLVNIPWSPHKSMIPESEV